MLSYVEQVPVKEWTAKKEWRAAQLAFGRSLQLFLMFRKMLSINGISLKIPLVDTKD